MSNTAFFQESDEFNDPVITITDQSGPLPNSVNITGLTPVTYDPSDLILAVQGGNPILTNNLGSASTSGWILEAEDVISGTPVTYERIFTDPNADAYLIQLEQVEPSGNTNSFRIRTSSDSGVTFDSGSSDYGWGFILQDAGIGARNVSISGNANEFRIYPSLPQEFYYGSVIFYKPFSLTANPLIYSNIHVEAAVACESLCRRINPGAVINAVQFEFLTQNIQAGTFRTYKLLK